MGKNNIIYLEQITDYETYDSMGVWNEILGSIF